MPENLEQLVDRMPQPEIIEVLPNSNRAFIFNESLPVAFTISWSWALAKSCEALIARDARSVIKLLFSDLDYVRINNNAVEDIRSILRQPIDENVFGKVQAKIESLKQLMSDYLEHPENNQLRLDYIIHESIFVVEQLKSLEVGGIGAFVIGSVFHLALLQEKANSQLSQWNSVKERAIEYSDYVALVSPKLIKLSLGLIDKNCQCTKCESGSERAERIIEYECRYFDGKDIHIFQELSSNAGTECNKHRLEMFYTVTDRVNQTAVRPVRSARKKWLELAASI